METSQRGINLIKSFEGFRSHAYPDQGGVWTIGYGTTLGVNPGDVIDEPTAHGMLVWDVKRVERLLRRVVKVPINQNQYDALVSFIYNIGNEAFFKSTALKRLNAKNYRECATQFLRWNKVRVNGVAVVSKGLANRRAKERDLFLEPALYH